MFTVNAYNNQYLRLEQNTMQCVLSVNVDANLNTGPAPLALAIALDRSGSMEGPKMRAARDGAIRVVQAMDETMVFIVVPFNDFAQVIFGPAPATPDNKRRAVDALQRVYASGGTCMSTALNSVVDVFGREQGRAKKVLFLTDGKNEGETRTMLAQAVQRCTESNVSISAWGVGTDWDAMELRYMADKTYGTADIIPTPQQIAATFTAAFNEMRKTAMTNARLCLWTPAGVTIKNIQQVYPNIVQLGVEPDPLNPRQQVVALGALAVGDQRDYLLDLEVPIYPPGQQFMMLRPTMRFVAADGSELEEKSGREGWVFVQWTEDMTLASQIEQHIAHYTHQEELSQSIREGQEALAQGDNERATRLLGKALEISKRTNNEQMTKLLNTIVLQDSNGTIRLNRQADAVARKTLAINVGRTSRLK